MLFGMVSGVGRGIAVLDGGGDRRREGAVSGVNMGRPIVTNEDFATLLFPNYFGQDLVIMHQKQLVAGGAILRKEGNHGPEVTGLLPSQRIFC